jgi:hypothetical protein
VDDEDGLNEEKSLCEQLKGFTLHRDDIEEFCRKVHGVPRQEQMLID